MGTTAATVGLILLLVVLLVTVVLISYLLVRRIRLMRGRGVDLCLRRAPRDAGRSVATGDGVGWHYGVGRYGGDELAWIRLTSLRIGASAVLDRRELEILDRREPADGVEKWALPPHAVILTCRTARADLELAMVPGTLTGFLSWLESAPPGRPPSPAKPPHGSTWP